MTDPDEVARQLAEANAEKRRQVADASAKGTAERRARLTQRLQDEIDAALSRLEARGWPDPAVAQIECVKTNLFRTKRRREPKLCWVVDDVRHPDTGVRFISLLLATGEIAIVHHDVAGEYLLSAGTPYVRGNENFANVANDVRGLPFLNGLPKLGLDQPTSGNVV